MKKLFSKIFRKKAKSLFPSLQELVASLVPQERFPVLLKECEDSRLLMQRVAQELGKTEQDILLQISAASEIPYLNPIPPFVLKSGEMPLTFLELWEKGAIPILKSEKIVAFACVDPHRARPLFDRFQGTKTCLATWFSVAQALDESEKLSSKQSRSVTKQGDDRKQKAALKVLELVMAEVAMHGSQSVDLGQEGGSAFYRFKTPSGVGGLGSIDARIWPSIEALFETPQLLPLNVKVQRMNSSGHFTMSWQSSTKLQTAVSVEMPAVEERKVLDLAQHREQKNNTVSTGAEAGLASQASSILLVDDDPTFAIVLSRFLARQELRAVQVKNAQEALRLIEQDGFTPGLVICDVRMPGMDGKEFLTKVKSKPQLADVPFLMLTSDDRVETELDLLESGADVFLSKSEDPRLLAVQAKKLLNRGATSKKEGAI